jgi:hypothetical protein
MTTEEKEGWVYCISNENVRSAKLPNNVLLKIGMTDRTPQERLAEANKSDTWRPPVNYKIEFAKKVKNALKKEKTLHKLLEQYNERVNRSREFFDISVEKARLYFDLMDGEYLEMDTTFTKQEDLKKPKLKPKPQKAGGITPNEITTFSELESKPQQNSKIKQVSNSKTKRLIELYNVNICNLNKDNSVNLIKLALNKKAIEVKVSNKYHCSDNVLQNSLQDKLDSTMIFSAIIKSVDDVDRIISDSNYKEIFTKLNNTAPSTFIILEEQLQNEIIVPTNEDVTDSDNSFNPKNDLENNPKQLELLENINIKDLSFDESKTLLKTAIKQEALHIKIKRTFHRFYELIRINPHKLKNTIFEASIVPVPNGIRSIDEDNALYINKTNYNSILKTLKNTSIIQAIILTDVCKM